MNFSRYYREAFDPNIIECVSMRDLKKEHKKRDKV